MEYLNRVELVGVVGDYKENDIFCRMTVCTNYAYQNGKDSKIETMWHNVLSNKKYEGISKGCCVKVVGRIRYTDILPRLKSWGSRFIENTEYLLTSYTC